MILEILSAEEKVYCCGEVDSVVFPGSDEVSFKF